MPEIWLLGLIFLAVFALFWSAIEIGIKWLILENMLVWASVRQSLLNSVFMQLLQIPGAILAIIAAETTKDSLIEYRIITEDFLPALFIFFIFRFISDIIIGGIFLTILKKDIKSAWLASTAANFLGTFFLTTIIVIVYGL